MTELSTRWRFGRYLELSGPGWEKRAIALRATPEERSSLQREFGSAALVEVCSPRCRVIDLLGAPDDGSPDVARYDLGLREEQHFEFRYRRDQLISSGYVNRVPLVIDAVIPVTRDEAGGLGARLVDLSTGSAELEAALGTASQVDGWWPYETWRYGRWLVLELRLGIVEGSPLER